MYIYLDIVEQFTCKMCGTCCRNDWQVSVNEEAYHRNRALFHRLGQVEIFNRAFQVLSGEKSPGEYACIAKRAEGGCWFLGTENLCHLHKIAGHEHLDTVCQVFPRYPMWTARGTEITLSFSCPEVLRLMMREEPLRVMRSTDAPIALPPESFVAEVFPRQKADTDPLRYYFELEHHVIDILQSRAIPMAERLALMEQTFSAIYSRPLERNLGDHLNQVFNANYEMMDANGQGVDGDMSAWLIEHFFINFIFKKPLFLFGPDRTLQLLQQFFQDICHAEQQIPGVETTVAAIQKLEFTYSHNRQALR